MTIRRSLVAIALVAGFAPLAAHAQVPPGVTPPTPPPQQQTAAPGQQSEPELVVEREVFDYPSFNRRNPFAPLAAGGELRFERLSLVGIIYSTDPTASVALLSTGGVSVGADGTVSAVDGDAYNAKVGQRIGNTTIREIQRDRVIVDVEEFGLTERRTMVFSARSSRRPGGTP